MEKKKPAEPASVINLCDRKGFKGKPPAPNAPRGQLLHLIELQQITIQHMLECEQFGQYCWCEHVQPLMDAVEAFQANNPNPT